MKWVWIIGGLLVSVVAVVAVVGGLLPQSHVASRRARFRQPPETVFPVVAGPPNWRSGIKGYGSLPGGQWWEEDSHGNKITYELVEERPPNRRVVRIADKKLPYGGTWTYELSSDGTGSSVRITENGEIYNVIFRFVARYFMGYTSSIDTYLGDLGRKFGETVTIED